MTILLWTDLGARYRGMALLCIPSFNALLSSSGGFRGRQRRRTGGVQSLVWLTTELQCQHFAKRVAGE
jgi:hypothetical protein